MKDYKIYIKGASQISIQKPLCEDWMCNPIEYNVPYARSIDPDFKHYISVLESRRMDKSMKRALATTFDVIDKTGIHEPDAIITGVGLGSIGNTEQLLEAMLCEGEDWYKPTQFMQSTYNTISSLISIKLKNHGYNATYSHKGISFDSALLDAYIQMCMGAVKSALVGGHDEMTPLYFNILQRIGYTGNKNQYVYGESAVSVLLDTELNNSLCEVCDIRLLYKPTPDIVKETCYNMFERAGIIDVGVNAIMMGVNGNPQNDLYYEMLISNLSHTIPTFKYKHIFGESYTASGFAVYVCAHCLHAGYIPTFMNQGSVSIKCEKPRYILIVNQCDNKAVSFILLGSICGR